MDFEPTDWTDYRVTVFSETYRIRASSAKSARRKACYTYVRSHDWFADQDPWRTSWANSEATPITVEIR